MYHILYLHQLDTNIYVLLIVDLYSYIYLSIYIYSANISIPCITFTKGTSIYVHLLYIYIIWFALVHIYNMACFGKERDLYRLNEPFTQSR